MLKDWYYWGLGTLDTYVISWNKTRGNVYQGSHSWRILTGHLLSVRFWNLATRNVLCHTKLFFISYISSAAVMDSTSSTWTAAFLRNIQDIFVRNYLVWGGPKKLATGVVVVKLSYLLLIVVITYMILTSPELSKESKESWELEKFLQYILHKIIGWRWYIFKGDFRFIK